MYRLLLIDDDPIFLSAFSLLLKKEGYLIDTAETGEEGIRKVREVGDRYALVLLDFHLRDMTGIAVTQQIRSVHPKLFILVHSGDPSRETLKATWQAGATGFLEKNCDFTQHLQTIRSWCVKYDETQRKLQPFDSGSDLIPGLKMVGRSKALYDIAERVMRYRGLEQNILILGETGTGKELVAQALKNGGPGQFLTVNCAVYKGNADLMESELFGYEKGAFTGATTDKKGIFETANGGTVFLDEIHHLSLAAQAKLLRVCQEKMIRRVGGTQEISVKVRLITSSKPDIEERCEKGEFLRDLYHRLNALRLFIPPLRDRKDDIEPLVVYFCQKYSETSGEKKTFLMRTIRQMQQYCWPGNVRELENMVYRLLADCLTEIIEPEHLDPIFFSAPEPERDSDYQALKEKHEKEERDCLRRILEQSPTKMDAAQKMSLSPSTLHSIMKRLGLYGPSGKKRKAL